jgi:hypothetical protein
MMKVLIGLAVLVVAIVLVGLMLPTEYSVNESVAIKASPEAIHAYVADLEKWDDWAPWLEEDPTIVTTLGEITVGVGASQTWTSKDGDGELTLTASDPATGIAYDMAFIMGDVRAPSTCTMTYEVDGDSTVVGWTMDGDIGDMMPAVMAGYMNIMMESTISEMFKTGLTSLKEKVE